MYIYTFAKKVGNMYFWNISFNNKILRKYIHKYIDNDYMLFCEY